MNTSSITHRLHNEYLALEEKSKRREQQINIFCCIIGVAMGLVALYLAWEQGPAYAFFKAIIGGFSFLAIYVVSRPYLAVMASARNWERDLSEAELMELANDETVDPHVLKTVSTYLNVDGKVSNFWVGYYINMMATPLEIKPAFTLGDGAKALMSRAQVLQIDK